MLNKGLRDQQNEKINRVLAQLLAIGFIILGFSYNPFLIFIGIFVIMAAQIETNYTESKYMLKGYKVRDVLMTQYLTIDSCLLYTSDAADE